MDGELSDLEHAVRRTLRAKVEHVAKIMSVARAPATPPPPEAIAPESWAEYERLDAAYREAREALDERIADRRAHPYA